MGVSDNDKSDGSVKPGKAYFYPSLNIHKLKREVPGVEPPERLVTALHVGIAKRSDVLLAIANT